MILQVLWVAEIPAAAVDTVIKVVTAVILSEVETWVAAVVVEEAAVEEDIKKNIEHIADLLAGKQNYNYFSVTLSICYFKTVCLNLRQSPNSGNVELCLTEF